VCSELALASRLKTSMLRIEENGGLVGNKNLMDILEDNRDVTIKDRYRQ